MSDFDSREWATLSLRMLACADELRSISERLDSTPAGHNDRDGLAALRRAANYLEWHLPIHGLTTICVVEPGIDPSDMAWLLREHLLGRNPGVVGGGEDLRRKPWIRHVRRPDDG